MPIRFGNNLSSSQLYVGGDAVQKIYRGAQQVWPVSVPAEPSTATATANEFILDPPTFDSGFALDPANNNADIPISGTSDAPEGEDVMGQLVAYNDKTDEPTGFATEAELIGTTGDDGSWSGTVSGPRNVGTEYRVRVWVAGNEAGATTMTKRCRIGHVWAIWGQSNESRPFNTVTSDNYDNINEDFINDGAYEGDVIVIKRAAAEDEGTGTGATEEEDFDPELGHTYNKFFKVDSYTARPSNEAGAAASPSVVSFANAFSSVRPGEKLLLIAHVKSGTSTEDALLSRSETDTGAYEASTERRDFQYELLRHQFALADGGHVGMVYCPGWIASNGGVTVVPHFHVEQFTGRRFPVGDDDPAIAGTKISITNEPAKPWARLMLNTYADGSNTEATGHDLRTAYRPDGIEVGPLGLEIAPNTGGLYDYTKTRFAYSGTN